jgi:competence protein ComEC
MNTPNKFISLILSFLTGVFLISLGINFLSVFTISFLVGFILLYPFERISFRILLLLIFFIGISFYLIHDNFSLKKSSAYLNNQDVTAKAIVISDPEEKEYSVWLRAELVGDYQGKILIKTNFLKLAESKILGYGDLIELKGEFSEPENFSSLDGSSFDFKSWLAKEGIYSVINYPQISLLSRNSGSFLKSGLMRIKRVFQKSVNSQFSEPAASFLSGLLLGGQSGLSKEFKEKMSKSGTTHLVALSGFNITIILTSVFSLFIFFGVSRSFAFWPATILIVFFVLLVGASPSIVRAAIMGLIALLGQRMGYLYRPRNILFFACFLMVLFNPKILVFDVGFQLSFLATFGILYLSPFLSRLLKVEKGSFLNWREILSLTLSAQIFVLPLLLVYFKSFSIISPLSNILILTVTPWAMLFGFLAALFGLFWPPLGQIISLPAYLLLRYQIEIIKIFGGLPL